MCWLSSVILLLVECAVTLIKIGVTALKTFVVALDFRISYSSIIEDMRRSSINKTLLKFFLNWKLFIKGYFSEHDGLTMVNNYFICIKNLVYITD